MILQPAQKIKLCKKGDVLYRVNCRSHYIDKITIMEVLEYSTHFIYKDDHGHSYSNSNLMKNCFKTMQEAEEEVHQRKNIRTKRELLKNYEIKLNNELGIKNNFIIK